MSYHYFCKIFNNLSAVGMLIIVTMSINSTAHATSNNCITPAVTIATITNMPDGWFRITGSINLNGTPLCSLVLANGQYMFTCGDSLPKGNFDLTVPPDNQGQITLFGFSSGLSPFQQTLGKESSSTFGNDCITSPTITTDTITSMPNGWFRIIGSISLYATPLCSLVLANGQYMFTCGDPLPQGKFDLTVPPDGQGQITLFGFSSGLPPFELTFFPSLRREAEDTIGDCKQILRTNASGGAVCHLNNIGDKANYDIQLPDGAGDYKLLVRYSNDDTGIGDNINVYVNGEYKNQFHAQNTRLPGVKLGDGWDIFVNSPVIHLKKLPGGDVKLTFKLVSTDGFGVDLDLFSLAPEF